MTQITRAIPTQNKKWYKTKKSISYAKHSSQVGTTTLSATDVWTRSSRSIQNWISAATCLLNCAINKGKRRPKWLWGGLQVQPRKSSDANSSRKRKLTQSLRWLRKSTSKTWRYGSSNGLSRTNSDRFLKEMGTNDPVSFPHWPNNFYSANCNDTFFSTT